jgi:hypothetical protein
VVRDEVGESLVGEDPKFCLSPETENKVTLFASERFVSPFRIVGIAAICIELDLVPGLEVPVWHRWKKVLVALMEHPLVAKYAHLVSDEMEHLVFCRARIPLAVDFQLGDLGRRCRFLVVGPPTWILFSALGQTFRFGPKRGSAPGPSMWKKSCGELADVQIETDSTLAA